MDNNIKFSIIAPVYKVESYLDDCVRSVLGQGYGNFELILVDDGSPDRSGEICDGWSERDSRVRALHKENGGQLSARCFALEHAAGDYFMFLDSDDRLADGALETLHKKISETDCDCVIYSAVKELDGEIIESAICSEELCKAPITDKALVYKTVLTDGSYNAIWRKCARRGCFDGRDYRQYYHVRHGEDLIQSLEILENAESFLFLQEVLYLYRCNRDSVTQTINYDKRGVDNTVNACVDGFIEKSALLSAEDIDAIRNTRLDSLAIELRARMRYCSSEARAIESMERLRNDAYISAMLAVGYRKAEDGRGGVRRALAKRNIALFTERKYKALIGMDKLMRRLKG